MTTNWHTSYESLAERWNLRDGKIYKAKQDLAGEIKEAEDDIEKWERVNVPTLKAGAVNRLQALNVALELFKNV